MVNKASPVVCLLIPKPEKRLPVLGGGAPGKLQDRDTVGITWRGLVSRCVQQQMLALAPFFFSWNVKTRENTFLCTYQRWGNENKME